MGWTETTIFYVLFGVTVSIALALSVREARGLTLATAVFFWPLYLPWLLTGRRTEPSALAPRPSDAMAAAIDRVETELEAALASLDGWAEGVLDRERERIAQLELAWREQADRIREMDAVLVRQSRAEPGAEMTSERARGHADSRRQNLERLRRLRDQAHDDLMSSLAWVRELVSMIHLAKFTGAPASRAEQLVAQIAAVIEGLREAGELREEREAVDAEPMLPAPRAG